MSEILQGCIPVEPTLYEKFVRNFKSLRYAIIKKIFDKALLALTKDDDYSHAKNEFRAVGYDLDQTEEDPNKWIIENVIELLRVFSLQGHSGSSAPFCIRYFEKLASQKPLTPLTGEDWEWGESFCDDGTKQNKRASHVFKGPDGKAYDINGKIFREPDGCCYTNRDSRVYVDFPYTPKSEYVDVENVE